MVNRRIPSMFSKTYVTPRRPYEKARLDKELKIIGEYGLRNKREVWRAKLALAKIRKAAHELLTLDERDEKRLFQDNALLRRLVRIGVLVYLVRALNVLYLHRYYIQTFLSWIRKQVVNILSFIVRLDFQKHIDFSLKSPFGVGRPVRVKRKNMKKNQSGGAAAAEEEE